MNISRISPVIFNGTMTVSGVISRKQGNLQNAVNDLDKFVRSTLADDVIVELSLSDRKYDNAPKTDITSLTDTVVRVEAYDETCQQIIDKKSPAKNFLDTIGQLKDELSANYNKNPRKRAKV